MESLHFQNWTRIGAMNLKARAGPVPPGETPRLYGRQDARRYRFMERELLFRVR